VNVQAAAQREAEAACATLLQAHYAGGGVGGSVPLLQAHNAGGGVGGSVPLLQAHNAGGGVGGSVLALAEAVRAQRAAALLAARREEVCVNRTQVCVNRTQVCVNRTQVCVRRRGRGRTPAARPGACTGRRRAPRWRICSRGECQSGSPSPHALGDGERRAGGPAREVSVSQAVRPLIAPRCPS
jgi:hypothetical protein